MTGGGGFLGAWIIRYLLPHGIAVRVFELKEDRRHVVRIVPEAGRDAEWVIGDVSDTDAMIPAARGCDAIIHLAGLMTPACQANPLLGAKVNVIGTLNAFEAAKTQGLSRVVYTSSGGVYGADDGLPPLPSTHYGAFKLANEGNARAYWADDGISSVGFRPFVVYGPGRDAGLTADITFACAAAAEGRPYTIGLSGAIALVYVEDVALAYVHALMSQKPGAQTVNLTGQLTTVEEVAEMIRDLAPNAEIAVRGAQIPSSSAVPSEWENCGLDLPVEHTLRQGLEKTIAFYRS